LKAKNSILVVV